MNRRLAAECFFVSPHFGNTHVSRSLLALLCYCLLNKACRYNRCKFSIQTCKFLGSSLRAIATKINLRRLFYLKRHKKGRIQLAFQSMVKFGDLTINVPKRT
jgi:hypothetical protein